MAEVIQDGELAVRLNSPIKGGIGNHPKGTVLRQLSASAFNTLVHAGGHQPLEAGEEVEEAVDATQPVAPFPVAPPAPPAPVAAPKAKRTRKASPSA